jgi:hypothetical protein
MLDLHNLVYVAVKDLEVVFNKLVLVRKVVSEILSMSNVIRRQFEDVLQAYFLSIFLLFSYQLLAVSLYY